MRRGSARLGAVALALGLVGFTATGAHAQDKGPNTGRISFSGGIDVPTDYFFRGIVQEKDSFLDDSYILQPYGDLTFKLWEGKGPLSAVGLTIGLWNSLHGGPTGVEGGAGGLESTDPKIWYESDFYTKLGATFFEDFTASLIYTAYMSPNGRFDTYQELAFGLGYNDSKLLGPFALNPSLLVAFEVNGQADAGRHRGVYLQAGVSPGLTLMEKSRVPLSLSFPLLVGLSLSEYYEFGGDDETFGYFSGGVAASVPLAFMPAAYGAWQARAGVSVLVLGDALEQVNNREDTEIIGNLGLALTY
jgi:hypothetical protein